MSATLESLDVLMDCLITVLRKEIQVESDWTHLDRLLKRHNELKEETKSETIRCIVILTEQAYAKRMGRLDVYQKISAHVHKEELEWRALLRKTILAILPTLCCDVALRKTFHEVRSQKAENACQLSATQSPEKWRQDLKPSPAFIKKSHTDEMLCEWDVPDINDSQKYILKIESVIADYKMQTSGICGFFTRMSNEEKVCLYELQRTISDRYKPEDKKVTALQTEIMKFLNLPKNKKTFLRNILSLHGLSNGMDTGYGLNMSKQFTFEMSSQ